MKKVFIIAVCMFCHFISPAQQDTLHLEEVTVTAGRFPVKMTHVNRQVSLIPEARIKMMPAISLSGVLASVPAADVRQRGPGGVQADVSIRGGTFDQVLVMVDGIKVSDPQSGHHNFSLPVPLSSLSRLEVLKGGASRVLGPDAFSGAVNLIPLLPDTSFLGAEAACGQYGYYHAGINGGVRAGKFRAMMNVRHSASAGYRDNTDFDITRMFFNGRYTGGPVTVDILAGWLGKNFGANGFYSPAFPGQYERFRTGLAAVRLAAGKKVHYEQSLYWRRAGDAFTLFRDEAPPWYGGPNYHRTDVTGTEMKLSVPENYGRTNLGLEMRRESILSTLLGEVTADSVAVPGVKNVWFNHEKSRSILSAFVEQQIMIRRFSASGGVLLNRTGDYPWKLYGGLDMGCRIGRRWRVFMAVNQSLRYPTFTDLYYHSPVNAGNPYLKPEEALTVEGGVRYNGETVSASGGVYVRKGKNLIDWVRQADSVQWHTMNHTSLTTTGFDLSARLDIRRLTGKPDFFLEEVRLAWAYATASKQSGAYLSKYALDYLHHQVILDVQHRLPGRVQAAWQFLFRDRAGTYQDYPTGNIVSYEPYFLTNVRFSYTVWKLDLFLNVSNLFNTLYTDIGNLPAPGIWVTGGVKYVHRFTGIRQ